MTRSDIEYTAAALYDGGWRAEDADTLRVACALTEDETREICELLRQYAEQA